MVRLEKPITQTNLANGRTASSLSHLPLYPLQVTLHSNMQKVIELSQSVVVDKSVIERFEEIQGQNYMSSSCSASENRASGDAAAAAAGASIMMAAASAATTTTTTTMEATAETVGGTTTRTTTTKSISMSTFETRRTLSSGSGSPSSSNASSCSSGSLNGHGNGNVPRPGRLLGTEKQSLEMLLLQHKQQLAEQAAATAEAEQQDRQEEQLQAEPGAVAVEEATTLTEAASEEHNQSDNNSRCNIVKQQITLSLDLSDSNSNSNEEQQRLRSQAGVSTPQTPITPTTPSAAAAAAAAHGSSSNIPQKPIKVQSDKDCTVPYNIINNYFSVGVVSTQTHIVPPPCPGHFIIVPVSVVECKSVERFVSPALAMQLPQGTCCRPHATRHTLFSSPYFRFRFSVSTQSQSQSSTLFAESP